MTVKLTRPQASLLLELPTHVVPEFKPALSLIQKGFAAWNDDVSTTLNPTEAGLARRAHIGSRGGIYTTNK